MPDLPPITDAEIARWRELDEKAPARPWVIRPKQPSEFLPERVDSAEGYLMVDWKHRKRGEHSTVILELIAEYRTAVPRLLDRVEALEAKASVLSRRLVELGYHD